MLFVFDNSTTLGQRISQSISTYIITRRSPHLLTRHRTRHFSSYANWMWIPFSIFTFNHNSVSLIHPHSPFLEMIDQWRSTGLMTGQRTPLDDVWHRSRFILRRDTEWSGRTVTIRKHTSSSTKGGTTTTTAE